MSLTRKELALVVIILLVGLFPRLWRINTDLQIHFDQGLHALETWNIWHEGKFTLLGHMTDTAGVFHGPLYYWFMAPAYFIGQGDPAVAAIWQIFLMALGILFLAELAKQMFGPYAAIVATLLYTFSYGYISYSRWLSNITPTFPLSLMFFWTAWKVYIGKTNYLPWVGLLASFITQMDGAIGIFLYPILLWLVIIRRPNWKLIGITGVATLIPHLPQLAFELRHDWVVTRAVTGFSTTSKGLGISLGVITNNAKLLFGELVKLTSWPWSVVTGAVVFLSGLFAVSNRRLPAIKFILISTVLFFGSLAFYQRGAVFFFLVPLFGLFTILFAATLVKLPKWIGGSLLVLILAMNIYQWHNFLTPAFALTPIGTFNLITNADRKNVVDWIYQTAKGKPFALWIYTIPYYLDQPWTYYFSWYGQDKYGYEPVKTGSFSPGDIDKDTLVFVIYEPDDNRPSRLTNWLDEVTTNFGLSQAQYSSADAWVELRSKMRP